MKLPNVQKLKYQLSKDVKISSVWGGAYQGTEGVYISPTVIDDSQYSCIKFDILFWMKMEMGYRQILNGNPS